LNKVYPKVSAKSFFGLNELTSDNLTTLVIYLLPSDLVVFISLVLSGLFFSSTLGGAETAYERELATEERLKVFLKLLFGLTGAPDDLKEPLLVADKSFLGSYGYCGCFFTGKPRSALLFDSSSS
jgi:hypothetical protein